MMQFESLANELLLDLFEYFDALHLFRTFYGLNSRFNTLLHRHFRAYHLDLRRISKQDFDTLCQKHLPSIVDRIVSLQLADEKETPGLPTLFLSRGFNVDQFIHLRSLSLHAIEPITLISVLGKLHRLIHLSHLSIRHCFESFESQGGINLINQVWNLPKLTHFDVKNRYSFIKNLPILTVISPTIEHLSMQMIYPLSFSAMVHLFQHTPRLRALTTQIESINENEKFSLVLPSILTMNFEFLGKVRVLNSLLQNMPNLCHLTIKMEDNYLNGHEWKQIIVDHLPKLKVLRFQMCCYHDTEEEFDELLDTFRTPFWLDEHQWYVRYDWSPVNEGYLYTLPYAFHIFTYPVLVKSKWTCPTDSGVRRNVLRRGLAAGIKNVFFRKTFLSLIPLRNFFRKGEPQVLPVGTPLPTDKKYWSFDRVHSLNYKSPNLSPEYFPNVHDLELSELRLLPDKIWSLIPTFDHLTSLSVKVYKKDSISDLQALFDRAPRLYSLTTVYSCPSYMMELCRLTSASIRQLKFITYLQDFNRCYFDDTECAALIRSPLGRQCEVLEICVKSRRSVVDLVNKMTHLRAMKVDMVYQRNDDFSLPAETELIERLQNPQSTNLFSDDCTNNTVHDNLKLWIR